jgi:hypothetical protein
MSYVLYGSGWHLSISIFGYLFYCALASLVVRIVSSAIKALDGESWFEDYPGKSPREIFLISLSGFGRGETIKDCWFPFFIGFAEFSAYPVFIYFDEIIVIGGWLAIKTAGQWEKWGKSRLIFNRFLVSNIVVLAVSYLWLTKYIIEP